MMTKKQISIMRYIQFFKLVYFCLRKQQNNDEKIREKIERFFFFLFVMFSSLTSSDMKSFRADDKGSSTTDGCDGCDNSRMHDCSACIGTVAISLIDHIVETNGDVCTGEQAKIFSLSLAAVKAGALQLAISAGGNVTGNDDSTGISAENIPSIANGVEITNGFRCDCSEHVNRQLVPLVALNVG